MDDSNSPSTSYDYDDAVDDIGDDPPIIFGCEDPSDSPSQSHPKKKKKHNVCPIPPPPLTKSQKE